MNKLVINSVKINDVNSIKLPVKEFTSGLNIVCGANEAGKSSMMRFLKEGFFVKNKTDLCGDIALTGRGITYQIKIDGENRDKNKRCILLAPQDKSYEDFLAPLDRNYYQRAFNINLDDINELDNELFMLIQDHNASKLMKVKDFIVKEQINNLVTLKAAKVGKELLPIIDNIKALDSRIRELLSKEDEYNSIIHQISDNEKEIADLKIKIDTKSKILLGEDLKKEVESIVDKIKELNSVYNKKLAENKSQFYNLTQKAELIFDYMSENKKIFLSKTLQDIDKFLADILRNYGVSLNLENLSELNLSRDAELAVRTLIEQNTLQKHKVDSLLEKTTSLKEAIEDLKKEIEREQSLMIKLEVSDYELHLQGVQELRAAIASLSEISENVASQSSFAQNLVNAVLGLLLLGCGIYLHNLIGSIVGLAGLILLGLTIPKFFKKNMAQSVNVYDYVKTDVLPKFNYKDKFLETVASLNNILNTQEARLKEYELLKRDFDAKQTELTKKEQDYIRNVEMLNSANSEISETSSKLEELTFVQGVNLQPDTYLEYINDARILSEMLSKYNSEKQRAEFLEKEINSYIQNFESFLKDSDLSTGINQTLLSEKLKEIQELIEVNEKNGHDIRSLQSRKSELEEKLQGETVEDLVPDMTLDALKERYEKCNELRGEYRNIKENLEDFEGLIDLRNQKNTEIHRLREAVKFCYQKLIVLDVIKRAEEKQRLKEPNLISAQAMLSKITGEKYVSVDFSSESITSFEGEVKTCDTLSRGTKEQVYLAFKLGYAQNYGKDGTNYRLPLIIDDAFVNFDKTRLTNILMALKEFSKTNQVLLFTCHKDYIKSILGEEANYVDID